MNHGNFDMKHPNDVGYVGGHVLNTFMPFNGPKLCFDDEDVRMMMIYFLASQRLKFCCFFCC
jgi:hypothetical protein